LTTFKSLQLVTPTDEKAANGFGQNVEAELIKKLRQNHSRSFSSMRLPFNVLSVGRFLSVGDF
jgi:hypothetical protein